LTPKNGLKKHWSKVPFHNTDNQHVNRDPPDADKKNSTKPVRFS